jgi:DNA-binding Xre family transcriptional regulator
MKTSKYTTLSQELNQLSQERQEKIRARVSLIRLEEITLKKLSKKLDLSEQELDKYLEIYQAKISDLEENQNLELNTLRALVNELGGTIEIIIKIPNKEPISLIS